MLNNKDAIAMIAVKDVQAAARFYEGVLGLTPLSSEGDQGNPEVITYRSGNSMLNIYHSEFAGTNKATSAMWNVGADMAEVVAALKAKGVAFEHYALPGLTLEGDVHVGGAMQVAWFKDPDGNILSVVSG